MKTFLETFDISIWVVPILTLILGAFLTKRNEMKIKLADKKAEIYSQYFEVLYAEKLEDRLYYYSKTNIILYGSRKVIEKLAIVEENGINTENIKSQLELIDLIYEMKKDIERPELMRSITGRFFSKSKLKSHMGTILFNYKQTNKH